jgi:hypothetical protein
MSSFLNIIVISWEKHKIENIMFNFPYSGEKNIRQVYSAASADPVVSRFGI